MRSICLTHLLLLASVSTGVVRASSSGDCAAEEAAVTKCFEFFDGNQDVNEQSDIKTMEQECRICRRAARDVVQAATKGYCWAVHQYCPGIDSCTGCHECNHLLHKRAACYIDKQCQTSENDGDHLSSRDNENDSEVDTPCKVVSSLEWRRDSSSGDGLSTAGSVGISLGVALVFTILAGWVMFALVRNKKRRRKFYSTSAANVACHDDLIILSSSPTKLMQKKDGKTHFINDEEDQESQSSSLATHTTPPPTPPIPPPKSKLQLKNEDHLDTTLTTSDGSSSVNRHSDASSSPSRSLPSNETAIDDPDDDSEDGDEEDNRRSNYLAHCYKPNPTATPAATQVGGQSRKGALRGMLMMPHIQADQEALSTIEEERSVASSSKFV